MRTLEEVLKSHHYHTPSAETQIKITEIRKATKALAKLIFETCPQHPDTTLALRDLESARMRAISCLAFHSPDSVMIEDMDKPTGASGELKV